MKNFVKNGLPVIKKENASGGKGYILIKRLLDDTELNGKCGLYAQVTIPPGCSLGIHEHKGESETYYILSGRGTYHDNGTDRPIGPGDVTFTPDGCTHGLDNTGNEDIVFMALIIFDNLRS